MKRKLTLENIDEDILLNGYRACVRDYCFSQTFCSSKCLMMKCCIDTSNRYGLADGEFEKWHKPELQKAMELIHGSFTIANLANSYTVTHENVT